MDRRDYALFSYLRQRKDTPGERRYSMPIMENNSKLLKTSVEDVLKSSPKAARVFLGWHAACVGCGFARFCRLEDVINTYQLDEAKFLEDLKKLNTQKL